MHACEAIHSIMIKLALTIIQSAGQFIPNAGVVSFVHIFGAYDGVYDVVAVTCSAGRSLVGDLADAVLNDARTIVPACRKKFAAGRKKPWTGFGVPPYIRPPDALRRRGTPAKRWEILESALHAPLRVSRIFDKLIVQREGMRRRRHGLVRFEAQNWVRQSAHLKCTTQE